MNRRITPVLPLALGATLAFVGCTDRMLDIDFVRTHFLEGQEEPLVTQVMPAQATIQAWGLAGGAFRAIEVSNRGTFFQGLAAPEPPYWYGYNGQWIYTTEPSISWDILAWGRPDYSVTGPETSLTLQISGLAPWLQDEDASHSLVAWASSSGYILQVGTDQVAADAGTAEMVFRDLTLEEDGVYAFLPALDGEKGDSVHVAQLLAERVRDPEGAALFADDRSLSVLRGFKVKDGLQIPAYSEGAVDRELEMEVVAVEGTPRTLDVSTRGNGFDALISEVGGVTDESAKTLVTVRPDVFDGRALPIVSTLPFLASTSFRTPDAAGPDLARVSWSDAAGLTPTLQVSFVRTYEMHGTTLEAGVVDTLGAGTTLNAAPLVGAPGTILIDGEEVTEGRHISNAAPTISWTAPTTGTATGYEVQLVRYTENVGAISWVVYTTETQVRLPPVFLGGAHQEDQSIVVIVTARSDTTEGFPNEVQGAQVPYGFAGRATPRFTAGTR